MGRGRETVSSVPRPALVPRRAIAVVRVPPWRIAVDPSRLLLSIHLFQSIDLWADA